MGKIDPALAVKDFFQYLAVKTDQVSQLADQPGLQADNRQPGCQDHRLDVPGALPLEVKNQVA
jgi:hypothetical protein